jgi:hypothetical protein
MGWRALFNATTGSNNIAIGKSAGQLNTTGSNNTVIGTDAGGSSGSNGARTGGTFVGYQAGANINASADYNTLIGYSSGSALTTGYGNTFLGAQVTASNITTGFNNILIGNNTFGTSSTASNSLNIGGILFGTLPATSTTFKEATTGSIGIATSSPFATFGIHANNGATNKTLFAIGSSTQLATTTLF